MKLIGIILIVMENYCHFIQVKIIIIQSYY